MLVRMVKQRKKGLVCLTVGDEGMRSGGGGEERWEGRVERHGSLSLPDWQVTALGLLAQELADGACKCDKAESLLWLSGAACCSQPHSTIANPGWKVCDTWLSVVLRNC